MTGHRAGHQPAGQPDPGGPTGWVDTACRTPVTDATATSWQGRPRRRRRTLDVRWRLRRADAVWASSNQDRSAAPTTRASRCCGRAVGDTGLATAATVSCRWYAAVQLAPWRTALLGRFRVERRASGFRSSVMASTHAGGCCGGPCGAGYASDGGVDGPIVPMRMSALAARASKGSGACLAYGDALARTSSAPDDGPAGSSDVYLGPRPGNGRYGYPPRRPTGAAPPST